MSFAPPGTVIKLTVLDNGILADDWAFTDIDAREMLRKLFASLTEELTDLVLDGIRFREKEFK